MTAYLATPELASATPATAVTVPVAGAVPATWRVLPWPVADWAWPAGLPLAPAPKPGKPLVAWVEVTRVMVAGWPTATSATWLASRLRSTV